MVFLPDFYFHDHCFPPALVKIFQSVLEQPDWPAESVRLVALALPTAD